MIEIDLSGLKCPEPYIKLIESMSAGGDSFLIKFDDSASTSDIEKLLKRKHIDIIKKECIGKKVVLHCKEKEKKGEKYEN